MRPQDLETIDEYFPDLRPKIAADGTEVVRRWATGRGGRLALVKGAYDLFHPGHLYSVIEARKMVDGLVAAVASDRSITERKGPDRPFRPWWERAVALASLGAVDFVVSYDGPFPDELLRSLAPCVVVASHFDYVDPIQRSEFEAAGVVFAQVKRPPFRSTTDLVETIRAEATHER